MNPIEQLHHLGQSLWYDNIQRRLLQDGTLRRMIDAGEIRGVTSNPSIFNNAIAKSHDYDAGLTELAQAGNSAQQIFNQLALEDIRAAADLFLPLYHATAGGDGGADARPADQYSPFCLTADDSAANFYREIRVIDRVGGIGAQVNGFIPCLPDGLQDRIF